MSARPWAAWPIRERLSVIRRARGLLAERTEQLVGAISPALPRTAVDTLTAEVLPLLGAMKFLEREAEAILAPRQVGTRGRPFWLGGVVSRVERVPFGHILVLGPANFPLFLPGVQVMQALAAGNRVTWKPGAGGQDVARVVVVALAQAGLPPDTLQLTEDTVEAGAAALQTLPDKVVFTGSNAVGTRVLSTLAGTATPAVAELSGDDAVFVLPSADLDRVAAALAFGLRLNGGAVCMAPRRLIAAHRTLELLLTKLPSTRELKLLPAETVEEALASHAESSFGLTASIFFGPGDQAEADALTSALRVGVVLHNDLIAPTADPRLPFGGRGASGYGVTRGAEGLLEMTAVRTVVMRQGGRMRHTEAQHPGDATLLTELIRVAHAPSLSYRLGALKRLTQTLRLRR